jgi:N-acylneuraminate cytidylyltransferase/CMP-N,N'-diacetyllegionaminic acid synthase
MKICTICARGGSKGVKNKNIRLIKGKPLIYFTVKQALNSKLFDAVVVSSDSEDILAAAKNAGADYLIKRPDGLATDTSAKIPVIKHALEKAEELIGKKTEILVDLDCTSPLRYIDDITNAVQLLIETKAPNIITGAVARRSPYFNLVEIVEDGTVKLSKKTEKPIVRRQDAPQCFDMNASIYAWTREGLYSSNSALRDGTRIYVMPEERSLDIDSELDFQLVEFLMNQREDLC